MIYSDEHNREHIKELQRLLYEISFYNSKIPMLVPDGIYDPGTKEAVRVFQEEYGIPVTGTADPDTWEKLIDVRQQYYPDILLPDVFRKDTLLIPGNTGTAVHFTQLMLNTIGQKYYNIPTVELTGIYDASTENSVNAFKNAARITDSPEGINVGVWNSIVSKFNKTVR